MLYIVLRIQKIPMTLTSTMGTWVVKIFPMILPSIFLEISARFSYRTF